MLLALLKKEVEEVEEALDRNNGVEMIIECADVMNFAFGIMISIIKGTVHEPGA